MLITIGSATLMIAPSITEAHWATGKSLTTNSEISTILSQIVFSTPGIVIISIFSLTLIGLTISKELKIGQINIWMISNMSRNKIIFSKMIFNWITILLIELPGFIFIWIYSGFAKDANLYIGFVILQTFLFAIFISMLSSLFMIITIGLSEKGVAWIIICSLIVVFITTIWVLTMLYKATPETKPALKFANYLAIHSLIVSVLDFLQAQKIGWENQNITHVGEYIKPNIIWLVFSPFVNISLSSLFIFGTLLTFKNKDLKI